jgi:Phage integrase, N-terminal SAM-like domain
VRGTFVHPSINANVTVAEWLGEGQASHSLLHKRATTVVRDESAIRRHLIPRLGDIHLAKLRQTDVQAFVADRRREVGPGTTRTIYGVLRAALNAAVNAELVAAPPPEASSCPKYPRPTWSRSAPRNSTGWRRHCRTAGNPWCTSRVPAACATRIRRSTVQWATGMPSQLSRAQIFGAPYTPKFSACTRAM